MTSGFEWLRPLAQGTAASSAVRGPRTGSLPAASFRFHLAADTLAVQLGVPVIKASIGTHTRPVTSWFAFACLFTGVTYVTPRDMPDARIEKAEASWLQLFEFSVVRRRLLLHRGGNNLLVIAGIDMPVGTGRM